MKVLSMANLSARKLTTAAPCMLTWFGKGEIVALPLPAGADTMRPERLAVLVADLDKYLASWLATEQAMSSWTATEQEWLAARLQGAQP